MAIPSRSSTPKHKVKVDADRAALNAHVTAREVLKSRSKGASSSIGEA